MLLAKKYIQDFWMIIFMGIKTFYTLFSFYNFGVYKFSIPLNYKLAVNLIYISRTNLVFASIDSACRERSIGAKMRNVR